MFLLHDESILRILLEGVEASSTFMFNFDGSLVETKIANQVVVPLEVALAVIVGVVWVKGIVYSIDD